MFVLVLLSIFLLLLILILIPVPVPVPECGPGRSRVRVRNGVRIPAAAGFLQPQELDLVRFFFLQFVFIILEISCAADDLFSLPSPNFIIFFYTDKLRGMIILIQITLI